MNALTVDPLYLQHAQSGRLTSVQSLKCLVNISVPESVSLYLAACTAAQYNGIIGQ